MLWKRTKSVTATFEEKLSQIIGVDDVFFGNGKWKIRKPKGGSGSGNTVDESSKQMLANCALSEIIFRTDGSFTIDFWNNNDNRSVYRRLQYDYKS